MAPFLAPDELKLYRLIYDRALASVMSDKIERDTTALFQTDGLTFKATGVQTVFKGYEAIYGDFEDDDTKILPPLKEGEVYNVGNVDPEQKFTKAPARFTEAKVVKAYGRKRHWPPEHLRFDDQDSFDPRLHHLKGRACSTESGIRTTFVLNKYFPELVSTEYTANMEKKLDEIEERR